MIALIMIVYSQGGTRRWIETSGGGSEDNKYERLDAGKVVDSWGRIVSTKALSRRPRMLQARVGCALSGSVVV